MEKIVLVDEMGNETTFYVFDKFIFRDNEYFILLPPDGSYYYLLKYDGNDMLLGVDNVKEYNMVIDEYNKFKEKRLFD